MVQAVERLHEAISDLLALDPTTLSSAELHEVTVALGIEASRLAAARAGAVEAWTRSGV